MRIYLTHCSKEKSVALEKTGTAGTPDELYTDAGIQAFMKQCKAKAVNWAILSDLYGIFLPHERHEWYEKHPSTFTSAEEAVILKDFEEKLNAYNEICFYIRPDTFHPFYEQVLQRTSLASKIKTFDTLNLVD